MAIGAQENFTRACVAFLRQSNMTDALILRSADVVEVFQALFGDKLPQGIDIAVRHGIFREDVVVGDDDHLVPVPDPGMVAKVLLEDADRAWPANVVGHENVHFDPDIVARSNGLTRGMAREDFFRHGLRRHGGSPVLGNSQNKYYSKPDKSPVLHWPLLVTSRL